jgi:ABC-type lipoprotein export system ATPase subunit
MIQNQIECISLGKNFFGKSKVVCAVENISLSVGRNEMVIIKGRSGAGKSTLLNLMCGLIKPTHGRVLYDNLCISNLSNAALSEILLNHVGIVFQSFNLLPTYTVFENIELAVVTKGSKTGSLETVIMSLLEQFGLKDKAYLMPSELSMGQQQKVAIIRTLIKQPSIIFADEPTGSVDDETAAEIIEFLLNLKNEKKITLVIATHGNTLEKFADRIFTLDKGRLIE